MKLHTLTPNLMFVKGSLLMPQSLFISCPFLHNYITRQWELNQAKFSLTYFHQKSISITKSKLLHIQFQATWLHCSLYSISHITNVTTAFLLRRDCAKSQDCMRRGLHCFPELGSAHTSYDVQYSCGDNATLLWGPNKSHNRESSRENPVHVLASLQEKIQQQAVR